MKLPELVKHISTKRILTFYLNKHSKLTRVVYIYMCTCVICTFRELLRQSFNVLFLFCCKLYLDYKHINWYYNLTDTERHNAKILAIKIPFYTNTTKKLGYIRGCGYGNIFYTVHTILNVLWIDNISVLWLFVSTFNFT